MPPRPNSIGPGTTGLREEGDAEEKGETASPPSSTGGKADRPPLTLAEKYVCSACYRLGGCVS
jgi:hypothetical protein